MVAQRRLRPLGVLVMVGIGVVAARAFQVQVAEHEVWASQAASLVGSASVVPYERGRFLDRTGRVLVEDERVAEIEFAYRDFRRRHPLGLVAHACTAIAGRPVTLAEVEPDVAAWAGTLVGLAPAAVEAFGQGGALSTADGRELAPAATDAERPTRRGRANDVRYYVAALLEVDRTEIAPLRRRFEEEGGGESWLAALAGVRGARLETLLDELTRRAARSVADLAELAELVERDRAAGLAAPEPADAARPGTPVARLLALLDARRAEQEDDAADELFRTACGFEPGRVPTEALRATFDLGWIADTLRWDAARLEAWVAGRRRRWEEDLERAWLPRILVRADLGETEAERASRLLDGIAALWRTGPLRLTEPAPWTELDEACVLHEAPTLFDGARRSDLAAAARGALPFQDEDLRALAAASPDPWRTVGLLFEMGALRAGLASPDADALAARWRALSQSSAGLDGDEALAEARFAVRALEADFSGAVLRALAALRRDGGPLPVAPERLDRAAQRERYVLVDVQSRPARLAVEPSYDLVHLVARDADRYAGFRVRETTRRVERVHDAEGVACAGLLIGSVRRPMLRELLAQSDDERRLASLQYKLLKSEEEERELRELAARLARPDEWTGDHGLEAWLDPELRGRFGLRETHGLDDELSDEVRDVPAVDGADVVLTLDAGLQLAAQDVLAHPDLDDDGADRVWEANPVGAIVLLAPDGRVLVAASEPGRAGLDSVPGRGFERSRPRERTMQAPTFNPPGSVFKPFVAAWALEHLGFDPARRFECAPRANGRGGFETMACTGLHHDSDLHHALVVSCNAYFAQLGLCFEPEELLAAAHAFGFGEPTGVRTPGGPERSGWIEHSRLPPFRQTEADVLQALRLRSDRLRFPNGLQTVQATPMQVARATAALVTGALPEVRVVASIGGRPVPGASRPLGISEAHLRVVRDALRGVVVEDAGSGHKARLSDADLGFSFACKTGSADIGSIALVPGMPDADLADRELGRSRKHTWVAGWFPAERPAAVLVVYMHNVTKTSSHTAVHLAAQFLRTDAVRRFVAEEAAR